MNFNLRKRIFLSYFGKIPYDAVYWLIRKLFENKDQGIHIWSRNSYELNYHECGFSDLDLTLLADRDTDKEILFNIKRKIEGLKFIFPFLGEINIYTKSELEEMIDFANFFELSRDPQLRKQYPIRSEENIVAQAVVFILRQLESDLWMLNQIPQKRIKKWQFIYNLVDREIPRSTLKEKIPFNSQKIIETMLCAILHLMEVFSVDDFQQQFQKLSFLLELKYKKIDFSKLPISLLSDPWVYLFTFDKTNIYDKKIPSVLLSPLYIEILIEKIYWEIFGNYAQTLLKRNNNLINLHFNNLIKHIEVLNFNHSSEKLARADKFLKSVVRER